MIPKVVKLKRLAAEGYRLTGVEEQPDGGVVVVLAKRNRSIRLAFTHFEVPAVLQATDQRPYAS